MPERVEVMSRPRLIGRVLLTLALGALFTALLADRLQEVDTSAVLAGFAAVSPWRWALALLATAASFWAVGRYDLALHRHLATGTPAGSAQAAGFSALAISQTVGLGLVSGALVRWRMLPDTTLWEASRLTLAVTVSFLMAWAVVTALTLVLLPGAPFAGFAAAVLALAVAGAALVMIRPRRGWPNALTIGRVLALAAIDCFAAGLALWLLMPDDAGLLVVMPAFLLALGAGLISGAPGGVGAFEMTLMALLPGEAEAELLAAVLAWRLVYCGLPALIGAGLAIGGGTSLPARPRPSPPKSTFAEAGLARQGEFCWLEKAGAWFLVGRTRHALVALHGPQGRENPVHGLRAAACGEARLPVFYKASARVAVRSRRAGFRVLALAREAWLDPAAFTLTTPARAGLRRKLRRAEAAGVVVDHQPYPDMAELAAVNASWIRARGAEFGFSMGRFGADYIAGQRVQVARVGPRIVGFASFHSGGTAWVLDLLRPLPDAPDGTAQALILSALTDAKALGVARVSLAAVPEASFGGTAGAAARIVRWVAPGEASGLAQFKAGFDPTWQRLYFAGPNLATLALAGAEIAWAIRRPAPLAEMSETPGQHAEYEFASAGLAWQGKGK